MMKTFNQFLIERSEEEVQIVKSFNDAIKALGNGPGMVNYLNQPMKKMESEVRKIEPKPILKPSADSWKRFNNVFFTSVSNSPNSGGKFKLNIKKISDNEFEYSFSIIANFRSVSYIGGGGWTKYAMFVVVKSDANGNVLDVVRHSFSVNTALRRGVNIPWRRGNLKKFITTILDVIAAQAGKDLIADAKYSAKQSKEMR